jgi:hypothetical protein
MTSFVNEYRFPIAHVGYLPMSSIAANLEAHDEGRIDDEHRAGIEAMKRLMLDGWQPPPIKVKQNGERLTGFKRWHAHKELGLTEIKCEIVDNWCLKKW